MAVKEKKYLQKAYDGLKPIQNPIRDMYFPSVST